jgi:hypothetical protein
MNRSFSIAQEFVIGAAEVVVELHQQDVRGLALEVTLLVSGMIPALTLRSAGGQRLVLTLSPQEKFSRVQRLAPAHLNFELGTTQGEYLQAVLLRAYRDEMAEVNHIHLEGNEGDRAMDLTLLFHVYRMPMSAEEAMKLMGD